MVIIKESKKLNENQAISWNDVDLLTNHQIRSVDWLAFADSLSGGYRLELKGITGLKANVSRSSSTGDYFRGFKGDNGFKLDINLNEIHEVYANIQPHNKPENIPEHGKVNLVFELKNRVSIHINFTY